MSRTDAAGVSQALSDLAGRLRAISLDSENTPSSAFSVGVGLGACLGASLCTSALTSLRRA